MARANALNGATAMALSGGDDATARLRAEEALALHSRTLGDAWGIANSELLLGNVFAHEHDFESARQLFDDCVRRFREIGDPHYTLLATRLLAWMYFELGDHQRARALHEENLDRAYAAGNERMQATTLSALAEYALRERRVQDALPLLRDANRIHRDLDDPEETAVDLSRLARAYLLEERAETAAQLLSRSEALREEIGASISWNAEFNEETLAMIRTKLDEEVFAGAWEQGRKLTLDEAVALALGETLP